MLESHQPVTRRLSDTTHVAKQRCCAGLFAWICTGVGSRCYRYSQDTHDHQSMCTASSEIFCAFHDTIKLLKVNAVWLSLQVPASTGMLARHMAVSSSIFFSFQSGVPSLTAVAAFGLGCCREDTRAFFTGLSFQDDCSCVF